MRRIAENASRVAQLRNVLPCSAILIWLEPVAGGPLAEISQPASYSSTVHRYFSFQGFALIGLSGEEVS
jgi:hypothetical protein